MCFSGALLLVGTAMSAASTIVQGEAASRQARANQEAFDANARIELMLAQDALHRGEEEVTQHSIEVRRLLARQALSAKGVDAASEYFDRIYSDTDLFSRLDAKMILENARREAWSHTMAARGYTRAAAAAESQQKYISAATAIGFGTSVLRGINAAQSAGILPRGGDMSLRADDSGYDVGITTEMGVNSLFTTGVGTDWIESWVWEPIP